MTRGMWRGMAAVVVGAAMLAGCTGGGEPTSLLLSDEELHSPPTLGVGDQAPPLVVSEWLHGAPVTVFEAGKVYVIDFWASWCGPCLAIMPRLSELQEKYKDRGVVAIALTALDDANSRGDVKESLGDWRPKFRVAIDGGPDGNSTVSAYLKAARETGIPRTYVVDQHGRLAWIGHPQHVEPVIEGMLAGTWDINAAAEERRIESAERAESRALIDQYFEAQKQKNNDEQLRVLDRLTSFDPKNVAFSPPFSLHADRIELLRTIGFADRAREAFEKALGEPDFAKEPWALAEFAKAMGNSAPELSDPVAQRAEELATARDARRPTDTWDKFIAEAERPWDTQARQVLSEYWHARGERERAIKLIKHAIADTDRRYPRAVEIRENLLKSYESVGK